MNRTLIIQNVEDDEQFLGREGLDVGLSWVPFAFGYCCSSYAGAVELAAHHGKLFRHEYRVVDVRAYNEQRGFEILDAYDSDILYVEARRYLDGSYTVWWTDGPRSSEELVPDAATARDAVNEAYRVAEIGEEA